MACFTQKVIYNEVHIDAAKNLYNPFLYELNYFILLQL